MVFFLISSFIFDIITSSMILFSVDMVQAMTQIANLNVNFTEQERTLFSVANKNVLASKRLALRTLESIEEKERDLGNTTHLVVGKKLKNKISTEIITFLNRELALIQETILPSQNTVEGRVFFLKLFAISQFQFLFSLYLLIILRMIIYFNFMIYS